MIVLEGCDGSGKTTLLQNLLDNFPSIEEHARASSSSGGPVPEVHEWAKADLLTQQVQPLSFYDRHPIFSEPVYGGIIRGGFDEWFTSEEAQALGQRFLENNLVIFCHPPLGTVIANINNEDQMEGVKENLFAIYELYANMLSGLAQAFPHNIVHYDYTREFDLEDLLSLVEAHQVRWNRKQRGIIA